MTQNKLCFSSFVFGKYQKYIPYYIFSIWKTYPSASIKIFIENTIERNIKEVLEMLNENGCHNFEIIEMKTSFDAYKNYKMRASGSKKMIRWLFGAKHFKEFDNVYIGDIDIFYLPEKISLLQFHLEQMQFLNLPFSNKVRLNNDGGLTKRITGLHFFNTKEYFNKIEPIISKVKNNKHFRDEYLKGVERDENFLYKINMEAFNFDVKKVSEAKRPWHGLHLGITRGNKNVDLEVIKNNSSLSISEIKLHLLNFTKDPIFIKIQQQVFVVEFAVILNELRIPYPLNWKFKAFKDNVKYKLYSIEKYIKAILK